jgi:two-component system, chemotaxis family, CheB/CheR fusion protein
VTLGKIEKNEHYIVAIGASAGGLEAIHEFFDNMSESSNLSFVVIQHLSPDHKSLLVELVGRHTDMRVVEASDKTNIEKNVVYIIPNDKFIQLQKGQLILHEKTHLKVPNNAIDVFMLSLAREMKDHAIGVILSGTGSDGTKGIATIKEKGGLVLVQEPSTSKFDGMPNSAISSGNVDFILPAQEMPQQIILHVTEDAFEDSRHIPDETLDAIFEEIRTQAGFDFNLYKTPTIVRRIVHRMMKKNIKSVDDYYNVLHGNPEECRELGREFLINVTRFFRDKEAFEAVKSQVLTPLIHSKQPGDTIKVWVSACSTGEEVYSIAIMIDELLEDTQVGNLTVKLFGTDIDRDNIEIAARGFFPKSIEGDVSPERLQKYFIDQGNGYLISPRLRKQIVFAVHNIIKDPPFIKNDLVTCRNMLIYMNPALQQRVYSVMLFAVLRGGYIFLGTTESANHIRQYLEDVNARWKIYKKILDARLTPYFPDSSEKGKETNGQLLKKTRTQSQDSVLWDDLKGTLLDEFNFAAFYIDFNFEIRETVGNFERVLSLPKKVLKLNLLRMIPASISTVLIAEIKKAWKTNEKRTINNLIFTHNSKSTAVQVAVRPPLPGAGRPFTMVAFHYMNVPESIAVNEHKLEQNEYVLSLEEELTKTKDNLQHAIEDLETANEELQSGNEELMSANEELQSSNEELQSLNEELHTLNTEHQLKIRELIELNDDLDNYFRSSDIGQVFLDKKMVIRKFNPAAVRMINFIETDIGRPINHISTNIRYSGLINDIEMVLRKNESIEREVELQNGLNLLLRLMPYLTQENKVEGVVISFVDITTITTLNNIIRAVFNSSLSAIFALESVRDQKNVIQDFKISATNHTGLKLVDREIGNIKGQLIKRDINQPVFDRLFQNLVQTVDSDTPLHTDVLIEPSKMWFEVTAVKMSDGVMATFSDITQKKNGEDRLKKNYIELITARENLKKLNNDLEKKIQERTQLLSASEERFRMVARATNDAIWDWDIVHNKIWFSDAFYIKFGYNADHPFDRKQWIEKIHPDHRKQVDKSMHQVINNGSKHWTHEYAFQKADGSYAHILDRGYVLHDDYHTPFRMLGSMLDITELKKAEQEIASNVAQRKFLAESMPLIVWTTNQYGIVDFVNKQFEMYTGMNYDAAINTGWRDAIHSDDIDQLDKLWKESIEDSSDFQQEIRIRMFNGRYHWNLLRGKVQKDSGGDASNWVITTIDINDQKEQNESLEKMVGERTQELTKMNHALEISNNDLQQFASVASHDLQEPLRKIHLYANLINDRHSAQLDGAAGYLQKILQSSARMKSIINNIMSYSKLSAENVTFEPTNLNEMINEILEDLEIAITEKKAVVHVGEFPMVETIAGQIRQVFQNIIGNALKFSKPNETPTVSITGVSVDRLSFDAKSDPKGNYICINIQDNGIGFDDRFAQNIFLLFQRLHSKDAYEGTGIGLAIAKKIIEKHHGIITAKSRENKGSAFTIILPVHQNVAFA